MSANNNFVLIEYMKANFAHELRSPFSAINISLSSLQKVFPILLDGYIKACNAGLLDNSLNADYLYLIEHSLGNSLKEIKFCDHYLNKMLLLIKDKSLISNFVEKISIRSFLERIFSLNPLKQHSFTFSSDENFQVEYNPNELESHFVVLFEEIIACKNEQKSDTITININEKSHELSFEVKKSKSPSYVCECIQKFMSNNFQQRYGIGLYLFNQLISATHGKVKLMELDDCILLIIKF